MSIVDFKTSLENQGLEITPLADKQLLRGTVGMAQQSQLVIHPKNVEEVQIIQKAAQASAVPLWVTPNSSGNGLVAPDVASEPVLVNLSRLNNILMVDNESASALVEPGVSYRQLREWLSKKGLKMWLDSGRNDEESILGGIWDRSFGYTVYGDHLMMQCGLEVVMTDGTQLRTGMGAFPKGDCWQLFKYGFGPYIDGSFTQSGLAIPTKVGFWISPEPPAYRPFALRIEDKKTLVAATEAVRDLRINMVVPNTITILDGDSDKTLYGGDPSPWNIYGALYGLPKNVDLIWGMLNGLAQQLGNVKLQDISKTSDRGSTAHAALMRGEATPEWTQFEEVNDSRYLSLVFVLPTEGEKALDFVTQSKAIAEAAGCGIHIEQGTSWRALLSEILITYEADKLQQALDCGRSLIKTWAKQGIGVVRTDAVFRQTVAETYTNENLNKFQALVSNALTSTTPASVSPT